MRKIQWKPRQLFFGQFFIFRLIWAVFEQTDARGDILLCSPLWEISYYPRQSRTSRFFPQKIRRFQHIFLYLFLSLWYWLIHHTKYPYSGKSEKSGCCDVYAVEFFFFFVFPAFNQPRVSTPGCYALEWANQLFFRHQRRPHTSLFMWEDLSANCAFFWRYFFSWLINVTLSWLLLLLLLFAPQIKIRIHPVIMIIEKYEIYHN